MVEKTLETGECVLPSAFFWWQLSMLWWVLIFIVHLLILITIRTNDVVADDTPVVNFNPPPLLHREERVCRAE